MSTRKLVDAIKKGDQDFEWYPSTDEIINKIKGRLSRDAHSILDCGAGDGRVLNSLCKGDKYAIEKSSILINQLDKDTIIIGTDFHETTLIDKEVDIIFSNPPYSEYENWASKIIMEGNAKYIYLVIPDRWKNSDAISTALKVREARADVIGNFDFLSADRAARANVDILEIHLAARTYGDKAKVDPFEAWFDANFTQKAAETEKNEPVKEKIENQLATGRNLISVLVELYNNDMSKLNHNFNAIAQLDSSMLSDLGINTENVCNALKMRIKGLKSQYWRELFRNYEVINKRLTSGSLTDMLKKLGSNMSVDFTESNAYAITGWVIKNANGYFDSQLVESVQGMVREANVKNYKSNDRVFNKEEWRYSRYQFIDEMKNYGLELRCILENQGGVCIDSAFESYKYKNGMGERGKNTINDLIVIANNLGFDCLERVETKLNWGENKSQDILCNDSSILMNVKAFQNGNIHIKFNQKFIQKLNVEFGRINGWLKSKEQAASELNIKLEDIEFNSNIRLGKTDLLMLK